MSGARKQRINMIRCQRGFHKHARPGRPSGSSSIHSADVPERRTSGPRPPVSGSKRGMTWALRSSTWRRTSGWLATKELWDSFEFGWNKNLLKMQIMAPSSASPFEGPLVSRVHCGPIVRRVERTDHSKVGADLVIIADKPNVWPAERVVGLSRGRWPSNLHFQGAGTFVRRRHVWGPHLCPAGSGLLSTQAPEGPRGPLYQH